MADTSYLITGGFFDAVDNDRLYSADQMNMPYKKLVHDGINREADGTAPGFAVTAGAGMNVIVASGNAMIGGKWAENKTDQTITVAGNTSGAARIDAIILQCDKSREVRAVQIVYRQGTTAAPEIVNDDQITEMRLANITVPNGAAAVSAGNITDTRGGAECPWVHSVFDAPDARYIVEEYDGSELAGAYQSVKNAVDSIRYAAQSGQPEVSLQVADMSDTGKVYLYQGTETGYDAGYLYYYSDAAGAWIRGAQYGASVVDTALNADSENPVQNKAVTAAIDGLNGRLGEVTANLTLQTSKNHSVSDESWTQGYYKGNGAANNTVANSAYAYSANIPVTPGDTVRLYALYNSVFGLREMYTICAYDADGNFILKPDSVSWRKTSYVVQNDTAYIIISTRISTKYMVTFNEEVTEYEPYITPGYVAKMDFLPNGIFKGISTSDLKNQYACALPKRKLRQTVGLNEKWYKKSMITPETELICVNAGYNFTTAEEDGFVITNTSASTGNNGYVWYAYDGLFNQIFNFDYGTGWGAPMVRQAENLSGCSLLAIGDSTIDHDHITGKLLSYFTEKGKTITLLGTLGKSTEPLNKNEGRAGWTTADYMGNTSKNGYTNPFYNPSTEGFDFSYYMTQQGYTNVDFVVIQLGINDLYPSQPRFPAEPDYNTIFANIKTMIDSILSFNSGVKIIINLPMTPNSNPSAHRIPEFLYRHYVIRYNEIALAGLMAYNETNVRVSYCHLLLNPATDISDNVHPTVAGYEKMALEIVNQINCWQNGV